MTLTGIPRRIYRMSRFIAGRLTAMQPCVGS